MNADGVERLIKALTKPYVGAEFIYKNKIIKVWDAKALHSNKFKNFEYGRVLKVSKKSMVVKCLDQPIELKNFNPKIKVKTGEYLGDKIKNMRKNKNILVLAPHPDDETLGCGGSILKHVAEGANVFWCIFTTLSKSHNYFKERKKRY